MLPIAVVFGTVTRGVRDRRLAALLSGLTAVLRLSLAFLIAATVYGFVLMAIVRLYPSDQPQARALYTMGLMIAALLGICAGTLAAPGRYVRFTSLGTSMLASVLPTALYLQDIAAGHWRVCPLLYLLGSLAACLLAAGLMPWAGSDRPSLKP